MFTYISVPLLLCCPYSGCDFPRLSYWKISQTQAFWCISSKGIASPQMSFGVRLSRIHFSPNKWTPKDVCGEASKGTVKPATKSCNLFCGITAKRVEKRCCSFYHPQIKPVLQQNWSLQVAKSFCREWRVVLLFATKSEHVAFFTCPRQTGFATSDVTALNGPTPA